MLEEILMLVKSCGHAGSPVINMLELAWKMGM